MTQSGQLFISVVFLLWAVPSRTYWRWPGAPSCKLIKLQPDKHDIKVSTTAAKIRAYNRRWGNNIMPCLFLCWWNTAREQSHLFCVMPQRSSHYADSGVTTLRREAGPRPWQWNHQGGEGGGGQLGVQTLTRLQQSTVTSVKKKIGSISCPALTPPSHPPPFLSLLWPCCPPNPLPLLSSQIWLLLLLPRPGLRCARISLHDSQIVNCAHKRWMTTH